MATLAGWEQAMRADGYSAATIRVRLVTVRAVAQAAAVEPQQLATDDVRAYLAGRGYGPWTRRKYLEHLAAWATFAGIADPTVGIRRPPVPRSVPRPVAEAALRTLLSSAGGQLRTAIVLGAYCGLRSSEACRARPTDLEATPAGTVLRVVGKGGRTDVLPAPPVVVEALRSCVVEWEPVVLSQRFSRHAARVGLPGLRFHQLRHRYGTALYAASRNDLLLTQQAMRHASPTTTAGYAQVANGAAAAAVAALPGAG